MKVLACDGIHEDGLALFRDAGWDVVVSDPIKEPAALAAALKGVDAILVRSATKVPAEALADAGQLRVIGRAGAGVDTIDVDAATERGIAVMNAPDGNTLAAAEHAISLLFALARHIPRADAGMKAGEWPKAGLTGFELEGKRLGVIGLGRIGGTVARKAQGIGMEVAAHDPFLPASAAGKGSVPLKTLEELLAWADVVTLHIPRTKETTNLLSETSMRTMKKGAYLINAARGGLVDEAALLTLIEEGHIAGAALDTFVTEPLPADSALRANPKLILTPHLGASTSEAQQAVSTILARQIIDFVATGAVAGCVNLPPLTAEAAREVGPWMPLMSSLGRLAARLVPAPTRLEITYAGRTEALDTRPLSRLLVAALLGTASGRVTPVNALQEAAARGLVVSETLGGDGDGFDRLLKLRVVGENRTREIEATLHRGPRVVRLDGVEIEFDPQAHVLLLRNEDRPGMIGVVGSTLGAAGVNIVNFALGAAGDGQARAAITVDRPVNDEQLAALRATPGILSLAQV
ncbi:phosphoglycerate dehydrogenase [Lysobacter capsici]|uniref:phosphoglycerate dehydrogenase n=1 Tax=Lysobacter capsici TaxID=435897 RepID=UPI0006274C57|nr:phosphoglycerate dehydrogenase [Lysobacter capsici]QWF15700.1 phosphoglycerate dehydrogenase [Lysobacter capsici]UOF13580.1 phosphoglycerate dehydrogenase [Lysobacter capsici]WND79110.1 phosphoglycerate dehydrogenase [Lysobacter capsici]WND84305.1 phosphoglycerate dehydrogenase [Lysobacter capsici]